MKIGKIKSILYGKFNRCHYCGRLVFRKSKSPNIESRRTLDHKIPKSQGGTDDISNLLVCCHSCNTKKGNLSYEEFVKLTNDKS